jgi:hypothetical protein
MVMQAERLHIRLCRARAKGRNTHRLDHMMARAIVRMQRRMNAFNEQFPVVVS